MLYTNLKLLRENNACSSGLATLIASLPKKHTATKLIPLGHILKSNGLKHGIWALRATTKDARKIAARMAIEFARQSLKNFEKLYPEDKRPRTALEAATDFLDGKITLEEIESAASAAWSAAWSAARSAAWSAASAARSAASAAASAARSAAASAAESAAGAAESAAAWSAAWGAAESAAESAAVKKQEKIFLKILSAKSGPK